MTQYTLTSSQHKNITDWLIALRSGDYNQCQKFLRDKNDNYCCLGVACEIQESERIKNGYILNSKFVDYIPENHWFTSTYGFHYATHMQYVSNAGNITHNSLTDLNDLFDFNFKQIADVIEINILNNCIIKD